MGKISPGLIALRKRYVTRAKRLCEDAEFCELTRKFRARWNIDFHEFQLLPGGELGAGVIWLGYQLPKVLAEAVQETYRRSDGRPLEGRDAPTPRAIVAAERWVRAGEAVEQRYWPEIDFPSRFLPGGFPGKQFISRALLDDPSALYTTYETLFWELDLTPTADWRLLENENGVPLSDEDDPYCDGLPRIESELPLSLMLYPGITEKDIKVAAKAIAEYAEHHYGHLSTGSRVRALRDADLTHKKIAERLGLHESSVREFLKNTRSLDSPEPQDLD